VTINTPSKASETSISSSVKPRRWAEVIIA
jgi:hypothetical protein